MLACPNCVWPNTPKRLFYLAVIIMSDISKLFKRLKNDFNYTFELSGTFSWSADLAQIKHPPIIEPEHIWSLIHEISHAELNHTDFDADIALLEIEASAWHHAATRIAPLY